jgi:hypothetical protein
MIQVRLCCKSITIGDHINKKFCLFVSLRHGIIKHSHPLQGPSSNSRNRGSPNLYLSLKASCQVIISSICIIVGRIASQPLDMALVHAEAVLELVSDRFGGTAVDSLVLGSTEMITDGLRGGLGVVWLSAARDLIGTTGEALLGLGEGGLGGVGSLQSISNCSV